MSDLPKEKLDDLRLFVLGLLDVVSPELTGDHSVKWNVEYVLNLRCENDV